MDLTAIINEMQETIFALQDRLDAIRKLESAPMIHIEVMMTRKEAADYIGRSVRQLDRLCENCKINKEIVDGAVRIRRSSLLRFKGIVSAGSQSRSEVDAIINRYRPRV